MRGFGPALLQLAKLEAALRPHDYEAILRTIRQSPASLQADRLAQSLESLDDTGRQAVYATLTDAELEGLCGSAMCAYLATLPDATIHALVNDHSGRTTQHTLRAYRRWRQYQA